MGGCEWQKGEVVMDANWRWVNKGGKNCYMNDNTWDPATCSDGVECAKACGVDGADYASTYGVSTTKESLDLNFVTVGQYSKNFGSRLYFMDSEDTYKMFKLKNREFTFDVDESKLTCGLNGALYFVEMDKHGDQNGGSNTAGAKYGTGYCDAQCPHDLKFIKGEANVKNWNSTAVPPVGHYGACCAEKDFCTKQKKKFGDLNDFAAKGSLRGMGEALDRGMVLVMSLWDDTKVNMLWLDAAYPTDVAPDKLGVLRGPCPGGATSEPKFLRSTHPDAHVAFSQIKVGTIGSTFSADGRRMDANFV